ncbi:serpentine type 7TM GPCR chemoreceptor srsx domain-containing protein [Ditylenchus destructor]|nr:serpentine type 7TM GPCR chemoreceptor srsx domain-containing protein [Ditylenchus destructor]
MNIKMYLSIMLLIILSYTCYAVFFIGLRTTLAYPDWPVICGINDIFFKAGSELTRNGIVINGASFSIYVLVWIAMQRAYTKAGRNVTDKNTKKIFKSIVAIMVLVVSSWLFNCIISIVFGGIQNSFLQMYLFPGMRTLLTSIASSSNPPLVYIFSNEYRRVFHYEFRNVRVWKYFFKKALTTGKNETVLFTAPALSSNFK